MEGGRYFHDRNIAAFISELVDNDYRSIICWEKFADLASAIDSNTIVFSLISSEYMAVGDLWVAHMRKCGASEFLLICADQDSVNHFSHEGFRCIRVRIPRFDISNANLAGFNPKALVLTSLKFIATQKILGLGKTALFSDIDAIWMKDVRQELEKKKCHIAFQNVHSFPRAFANAWGVAACSGFFYATPEKASMALIQAANRNIAHVGDDQLALNIAIAQQSPSWTYMRPELVEVMPLNEGEPVRQELFFGVSSDLTGRAEHSGLKITALAHKVYRRHLRLNLDPSAALVFHPNSPKEQAGKLRVFREYGIS